MAAESQRGDSATPPWQATVDCTIKGTEDYCAAQLRKLDKTAQRLGFSTFIESEPNCDLDVRRGGDCS